MCLMIQVTAAKYMDAPLLPTFRLHSLQHSFELRSARPRVPNAQAELERGGGYCIPYPYKVQCGAPWSLKIEGFLCRVILGRMGA